MWSAFVTGFATKATELIEERDKEIQDNIKVQLSEMFKSRQKALQASETRSDELRKTASQLRGYGIPDAVIGEIITSGDSATISELFQKESIAGTLTPAKIQRFIGERSGQQPSEALDTIIKRFSTPVKSTTRMPLATEMKGAFGLPTPAAKRTIAETTASTGMTLEELQATEMPEIPLTARKFDYSVFKPKKDAETTAEIQYGLRDIIARAEQDENGKLVNFANEEDAIEFSRLTTLSAANAVAAAMVKIDEDKPETDSQIRTIFKESLTTGLTPFIISNVAQIQSNGDVVPITGDVEDIQSFLSTRNRIVKSIAVNRGYIDPRTGRVSSRAAENALTPYAVIEDGKVVSWKTGAPGGDAKPAQPAAAPRASTPTATAPRKPPQAAIERLKANKDNPKARADFDAVFGAGSADEALKSGK